MKLKDIMACALRLVGRKDVAEKVSAGASTEGECAEAAETMLYCVNAVEDELARCYFPLVYREEVRVNSGRIYFTELSRCPVKITGVQRDGEPLRYALEPQYIEVNADRADVEYWYTPVRRGTDGDSAYDGTEVGERLIAEGAASEYCLLNGEALASQAWETRYRESIDRAQSTHRRKYCVPPRRWV